jgi:hypothetical protein
MYTNKFFDTNGEFKAITTLAEQTVLFDSIDAALDKAEELGLSLERVDVKSCRPRA